MAYGTRVAFDAVREIAAVGIGAAYTAVGTSTSDYGRQIRIVSTLDEEVYISFDGTTDNLRMAEGSFILLDFVTNEVMNDGFFLHVGTTFYVKRVSAAPTTGSLWIEVIYAQGGI